MTKYCMSNIGPVVATFPKLAAQKEEKELGKDVVEDADAQGDKVEEGGGGMGNVVSE